MKFFAIVCDYTKDVQSTPILAEVEVSENVRTELSEFIRVKYDYYNPPYFMNNITPLIELVKDEPVSNNVLLVFPDMQILARFVIGEHYLNVILDGHEKYIKIHTKPNEDFIPFINRLQQKMIYKLQRGE